MSHNFEKFIKGETFKKEDILRVLDNNKIKSEIIDIRYHHFKKIFIKIKENEKFFLLKLSLNSHSINLTKNESDGYSFFTKFDTNKFRLPDYQLINLTENYALSKIELIDGRKGNYFEYSKFCINYNQNQIKKINLNDYIELIWKKYSTEVDKDNKLFQMMKMIITKFDNTLIPLEASHGDFIHYNAVKSKNNYFIFDLEFFKKDGALLYDYLHWHLTPLINKCTKSKIYSIFFNYTNNLVIKLLKLNIKNKVAITEKKIFEILLLLFLFERCLTLLQILNLKDFENLVSNYEKDLTQKNFNFIYSLLVKLVKK